MKNPTAAPLPEQQVITAQEQSLLLAYRAMDDRGQFATLAKAAWQAEKYPRRSAPALRLIAGGTK